MAQGRNPKPTAQKVLEGNPGKRELNTKEPKPEKKLLLVLSGLMMKLKKSGNVFQSKWSSWVF